MKCPVRELDVLIVGAGFAGAATAYHLSRGSSLSVAIVEREKTPGVHASGRNASLVRQSVEDPVARRLAAASTRAYRRHRERLGFEESGSLLLGGGEALAENRQPELVASETISAAAARQRCPTLAGHRFDGALWTPGDGVLDTWALLGFYLEGAADRGVETHFDCPVTDVEATGRDLCWTVATPRATFKTRWLVDAAGAWASRIAELAHVAGPPLEPLKRHLFVLDAPAPPAPGTPWAWNLERGIYFRPESGGLLLSICDEERSPALSATVSAGIEERLAERVLTELPHLRSSTVRSVWSCFRTRSGDGRFVIGPEPSAAGFFWVAGLWGHGMTCSWEVGRIAAELLLGRDAEGGRDVDPGRFPTTVAGSANEARVFHNGTDLAVSDVPG